MFRIKMLILKYLHNFPKNSKALIFFFQTVFDIWKVIVCLAR